MAEQINHGKSKLISNYGGVGSVIDTQNSSIIIETFDNWHYPNFYDQEIRPYLILDDRLLNRLKTRFPRLRQLVNIPTEEHNPNVQPQANHFPKWFYCPRCKRFMHYFDWNKHWKNSTKEFSLQCFNPDCKEEHLEQVRFVMTCDNGHIQDLPWEYWNKRKIENAEKVGKAHNSTDTDDDIESESKISLRYGEKCCLVQELYYEISGENTDLSGIHIKCKKCGNSESLKGIFGFSQKCGGRKYWLGFQDSKFVGEECDKKASVKIKFSNSIYYANTLSSIWIPEKQVLTLLPEMRTEIDAIKSDPDFDIKDLEKFARRNNIAIELINQYLDDSNDTYIPEIVYRKTEYDYFLNKEQPEDKKIKFRQINVKDILYGFEKLIKIDKLKKITVQTSFTRNEPIDIDSILVGDETYIQDYNVKRQSVSKNSFETSVKLM
jgi:predicted nucleic-acid-binding Zn-ribbon protein